MAAPAVAHEFKAPPPHVPLECYSYPHDHDEYEEPTTFTLMKDAAQDLVEPHIRGIAYDTTSERLYVSACDRREFGCDIFQIDSRNGTPDENRLTLLRLDARYGYTQPAVSPDGKRLVVVRTPRRARPSQDNIRQELVAIDLTSAAASVLAVNAPGERFEATRFLGDSVAVWRSYKSQPTVGCRGDFCTDRLALVLFTPSGGKIDAPPTGWWPASISAIDVVPIGRALFAIYGVKRAEDTDAHPFALLDTGDGARMLPFRLSTEMLAELERNYADRLTWPPDLIARYRPLSSAPACATADDRARGHQFQIISDTQSVHLIKTPQNRRVYFDITWRQKDERLPWAPTRRLRVAYPNWYGNPLAKEIDRRN